MYSFPNLEPVCCSMSGSNCCFLTCIQISQEAGKVVWYSHLFKNFPQSVMIHSVKDFRVVNEAEVDFFFENSLAFSMIQWMLTIWPLVYLPFLNQLVHVLDSWTVETQLEGFWTLSCSHVKWVQLCGSLNILWHCPSLGLGWKLTFSSPVAAVDFSKFAGILSAAL